METLNIPDGFQDNNIEKKETRTFIYMDHSREGESPIVFTCEAKDILEADERYNEYFSKIKGKKIDVSKEPHIGCISPIED